MVRDNVDSTIIVIAMVAIACIGYVAFQAGQRGIASDCLKLNKFQIDGREFHCYPEGESGEDA